MVSVKVGPLPVVGPTVHWYCFITLVSGVTVLVDVRVKPVFSQTFAASGVKDVVTVGRFTVFVFGEGGQEVFAREEVVIDSARFATREVPYARVSGLPLGVLQLAVASSEEGSQVSDE